MKKLLIFSICIVVLGSILASCQKESDSTEYRITYGMVSEINSGSAIILTDDGANLRVVENMTGLELKPEDRIIFNYNVLPTRIVSERLDYPVTDIRLNEAEKLLCKAPVAESFILEDEAHRSDSIGNDPIEVYDAWFGGKYLNIRFGIKVQNTNVTHLINLVLHDSPRTATEDASYQQVTLHHNAHDDSEGSIGIGFVSFDISRLVPASSSGVKIRLNWKGYSGTQHYDEDTFEPYTLNLQAYTSIAQPRIGIK